MRPQATTDGMLVAHIRRRAGISQATYFNWKKYDEHHEPQSASPPAALAGQSAGAAARANSFGLQYQLVWHDRATLGFCSCGLVAAGALNGPANPTFTWTGATGYGDEVVDISGGGKSAQFGSAHVSANASVSYSSSHAVSFSDPLLSASWAP